MELEGFHFKSTLNEHQLDIIIGKVINLSILLSDVINPSKLGVKTIYRKWLLIAKYLYTTVFIKTA